MPIQPPRTPFEEFLLASTPFITQLMETDTLLTAFGCLEKVSDVGVEVFYTDPSSQNRHCDIYLPTLHGISCFYKPTMLSSQFSTYSYNEEDALYQRMPLVDKLQDLSESDPHSPFQTPIGLIAPTSSWVSIEWHLHYTSHKFGHSTQKSIIVYYMLDFNRIENYLPIVNWEIKEEDDRLQTIYQMYSYPYQNYQLFDLLSHVVV